MPLFPKSPTIPLFFAIVLTLNLAGCAGAPPSSEFSPCPSTLNCISSDAIDEEHIIGSFRLAKENDWDCLIEQALQLTGEPRVAVKRSGYVRIEYTSATLQMMDDLELMRMPGEARLRSAARVERHDLGRNRARGMQLHAAFRDHCSAARIDDGISSPDNAPDKL